MTRSSVVLPAPLGPMTATASPALTSRADVEERLEAAVAGADTRLNCAAGLHSARRCPDRPRSPWGRAPPRPACPSAITSPWSSTTQRSTTRISTPMMCSTQTMVMPRWLRIAASMSAAWSISEWSRPPRRLVGQQQLRLGGERARELELLQPRSAQSFDARAFLGRQADELQALARQAVRPTPVQRFRLCHKRRRAPRSRRSRVAERPRDLIGAADARVGDAIGRQAGDLAVQKAHRSGRGPQRAGDAG